MTDQWTPWIELHTELFQSFQNRAYFLDSLEEKGMKIPQEYESLIALALSVAHWHPDADPRGGIGTTCPLCQMFPTCFSEKGQVCPLSQIGSKCYVNNSSWMKWLRARRGSESELKYADQVYQALLKCYIKEYKRLGL